jgi:hypothetical protein
MLRSIIKWMAIPYGWQASELVAEQRDTLAPMPDGEPAPFEFSVIMLNCMGVL